MTAAAFANFPGFKAGGTIVPCQLLKLSTSAEYTLVANAAGSTPCFAVSGEGQKGPPGLTGSDSAVNAESGDQLVDLRGPGDKVLVVAGTGGITKGAPVESDANGAGVLATGSGQHYIAGYALTAASAGEKFYMLFQPQQITL